MINKIKETLSQVFSSKDSTKLSFWDESDIECAVDEEVVECAEMSDCMPPWGHSDLEHLANNPSSYTGVPAPAYLEDDEWFGPAPVKSQKQLDYMEQETIVKQEEEKRRQEYSGEPCNMHQLMYEMATSNWNTVAETQGGSENFQGGSENVHR